MKQPHIQFYVGDWLKDPQLSMCSPATRGVWIDMICRIHDSNTDGKLTATLRQMSQLCRCTEGEVLDAINEIKNTSTGEVYEENGVYTIINRRIKRSRELSIARQQAGSKGAASTQAKREQIPDIDNDIDGILRVREFAKGEGISEKDAEWFYWKGKGNGWTNGGKPMKDWKATLRSWHRAGYLPSQKQQSRNGPMTFQIPKELGPSYPSLPPKREPTDEEILKARTIAKEETQKLREKLRPC